MWQGQRAAKAAEPENVVRSQTRAFVSQEPCASREVVVGTATPLPVLNAAALTAHARPLQGEEAEITLKLEPLESEPGPETHDRGLALILVAVTLLAMAAIAVSAVPATEPLSSRAGAEQAQIGLEESATLSPSVEADLGMQVVPAELGAREAGEAAEGQPGDTEVEP